VDCGPSAEFLVGERTRWGVDPFFGVNCAWLLQ
jgi:hypothetical protein